MYVIFTATYILYIYISMYKLKFENKTCGESVNDF